MDGQILITSFVSCLIFVVAQIVVFRLIDEDQALLWLVKLYFLVEGISLVAGFVLLFSQSALTIVFWHIAIVTLFVAAYILNIFSFTEASITMRLLTEIAYGQKNGVTKVQILKIYNRTRIVRRRLSRFIAGGDVVKVGSSYQWKSAISPFVIRERILSALELLFPRMKKSGE